MQKVCRAAVLMLGTMVVSFTSQAQLPQQEVPESGSLSFQCNATLSEVPLISPVSGSIAVWSAAGYGGFFRLEHRPVDCGPDANRFITGPVVSGAYADGTALFAAGGHIHLRSTRHDFGLCDLFECTFDGEFDSARIERIDNADGTHTYRFAGHGTGKLTVPSCRQCEAAVTVEVLSVDWSHTFDPTGAQTWGMMTAEVTIAPQ